MAIDSKIILKCDINTKDWIYAHQELCPWYVDVHIGFFDNNSNVVDLRDLEFGYELKLNNKIKYYNKFPKSGCSYLRTDQEFIEVHRLDDEKILMPGTTYQLRVWTEHKGILNEKTFGLTIPTEVNNG